MKIYLKAFGCRANQYDSEAVRSLALDAGAEIVARPEEADVAVFNSCAVTADAEADLRQAVRRANRENPSIASYIMGCASALELSLAGPNGSSRAQRISELPSVRKIFAGADIDGVAAELGLSRSLRMAPAQSGVRALLRIQDGCDEHCTFCATTLARGDNRSRSMDFLVEEARCLAEHHREIVLTGVHIGSYGADNRSSLSALVEKLLAEVPHVRFRLSSLEATEVDDRLAELFAEPGLAPHLHAPLQSGSDRILKRMGRHWYTASSYSAAIEKVVSARRFFGLGADVIAGFPGESEDDHEQTLHLIESLPFTSLHVFSYSERPGIAATRLPAQVDPRVTARRAAELREVGERKASNYNAQRTGSRADVIVVSGPTPGDGGRNGLTEDYLNVRVPADSVRGSRFNALVNVAEGRLYATPITG